MTPAEMRAALAATLESQPHSVAVTLRYNDWPISPDRLRRDLRCLHGRLDRQIYGPRYHLSKTRTAGWFVLEKPDCSPHWHGGLDLAPEHAALFTSMLDGGLWKTIAGQNADHNIKTYWPGWAGYAIKSLRDTSRLILCDDFIPVLG